MSFGSLSAPAKEALGRGATAAGTSHHDRRRRHDRGGAEHSRSLVYQVLPSRYGMNPDDLRQADAIEIVVGQGAKPGGGGMLLGQKISERVAEMRALPEGIDQRSACRHPDWTGPDDLEIKIERAARDHRLGEADLRQGRRLAALLRHRAGGEGRRRRRGARRHAGRHRGDPGSVHRACRHPDAGRHPPRGAGAAGARHAPQGATDRLGRHPQRRRRRQGPGARRRRGLDRHGRPDRARRQRSRAARTNTRRSAPPPGAYDDWHEGRDPAGITTQDPALAARLDPVGRARGSPTTSSVLTLEAQTIARACGKSHCTISSPRTSWRSPSRRRPWRACRWPAPTGFPGGGDRTIRT